MNENFKKGLVTLIRSNMSFEERSDHQNEVLQSSPDTVLLYRKNINIEDIRYFQNEFQKSSQDRTDGFKKLGCIIFDDISIQAQNSLLKILEDIEPENGITLFTNKNIKLLPTIMSRVFEIEPENEVPRKTKKPELPDLTDKENPLDKQQVIEWIKYTIENSKINKNKKPLIWINSPSPNVKYIIEYVNLFY